MEKSGQHGIIMQTAKGVVLAVISTLIGILLFALLLKIANLSQTTIKVVNQFLKAISLFIGCLFSLKDGRGLIKGLIVGAVWACVVYLFFLILGGVSGTAFLIDLIFGLIVGAISGVTVVNIKG